MGRVRERGEAGKRGGHESDPSTRSACLEPLQEAWSRAWALIAREHMHMTGAHVAGSQNSCEPAEPASVYLTARCTDTANCRSLQIAPARGLRGSRKHPRPGA